MERIQLIGVAVAGTQPQLWSFECTKCGVKIPPIPRSWGWHRCPGPAPQVLTGDCIDLLAETGEKILCPTCSGKVGVKVFGCRRRSERECTKGKVVTRPGEKEPLPCCALCNLKVTLSK